MCVNYGKDDTEADNDSSDEEEAVDGYDMLQNSVMLSALQIYERMFC